MNAIAVSVSDLFEVSESDTVWDAWLTTVNLIDMLEHTHRIKDYDFPQARDRIAKLCRVAEAHSIDRGSCTCGMSDAEHAPDKAQDDDVFQAAGSQPETFCMLRH